MAIKRQNKYFHCSTMKDKIEVSIKFIERIWETRAAEKEEIWKERELSEMEQKVYDVALKNVLRHLQDQPAKSPWYQRIFGK
jgi:hypothetical protein